MLYHGIKLECCSQSAKLAARKWRFQVKPILICLATGDDLYLLSNNDMDQSCYEFRFSKTRYGSQWLLALQAIPKTGALASKRAQRAENEAESNLILPRCQRIFPLFNLNSRKI